MKKEFSLLTSLIMVISLSCFLPDTIVKAETSSSTNLYYDNVDTYLADCISKGVTTPDVQSQIINAPMFSATLKSKQMYQILAEGLINNDSTLKSNQIWITLDKTLEGEIWESQNWEVALYTVLLMDFLTYQGQTDEFESDFEETTALFAIDIYDSLVDYISEEIEFADTNDFFANATKAEAEEYAKKIGYLDTTFNVFNGIKDIASNATEYYETLCNIQAVNKAKESRINFLKKLKEFGSDDEYLCVAVDEVIRMHEIAYENLKPVAAGGQMLQALTDYIWTIMIDENPAVKEVIEIIKLGKSGLNWLLNSDDISESNLKLVILYIMNSYAIKAVQDARNDYFNNPTQKNAQILKDCYSCYLVYQKYATDGADTFLTELLFEGTKNKISNIFSDENINNYKDFKSHLEYDEYLADKSLNIINECYKVYNAYTDDNNNPLTGHIPRVFVESVEFDVSEYELAMNHTPTITASTYPTYANIGTSITYSSSNTDVIEVDSVTGKITPIGEGTAYSIATSGNGKTDKCKVTVYPFYMGNNGTYTVKKYVGESEDVIIPSSINEDAVTIIESKAFYACSEITSITIPNSVTDIRFSAFEECSNLANVIIGKGVTTIGSYAFYNCDSLTSITIPGSVTSIGEGAFKDCKSLTSITIPDSVTCIDCYTFENCTNLTSITIGNGVTAINPFAFDSCYNLKYMYYTGTADDWAKITFVNWDSNPMYYAENEYFNNKLITNVVLSNEITCINAFAFNYCDSLISVLIPDSVTNIGDSAFGYCESLESVIIPDSVTNIGHYAFHSCNNLSNVTIPDSVTSIGDEAFFYCKSLQSITIPYSVSVIGSHAFDWCTKLSSINVDENNKCYSSQDGVLFNKDKTELIEYPAGSARTDYTTPSGVVCIGNGAFSCSDNLTSVTISDNVTSIGELAFEYCSNLSRITIPDSIGSIGSYAFYCCNNFTDVYFGGTDNQWAKVEIDYGNDNLLNAKFHFKHAHNYGDWIITTEPTCTNTGLKHRICDICDYKEEKIICATGHSYENGFCIICNVLEGLKHNVNASNKITITGYEGILTELEIPSTIDGKSVTCIAESAFSACTKLTSIIIPESITNIEDNAFSNNTRINCYTDSVAHKYAVDNNIRYKLLNASLPGDVYFQYKNDNTMIRFIAEVDIEDVLNADSGEITVFYNEEVLEVKSITGAYKSLYAAGQVITAPEGKCYIISNQYTGFMYDDMMSVEYTLDNYDLGLSRDVIIE